MKTNTENLAMNPDDIFIDVSEFGKYKVICKVSAFNRTYNKFYTATERAEIVSTYFGGKTYLIENGKINSEWKPLGLGSLTYQWGNT